MTIEEKAIANLKYAIRWNDKPTQKSMEVAIASLEAWDEVKQKINDLFSKPACYIPNYDAYKMFLEIIDKHLQEVRNENTD